MATVNWVIKQSFHLNYVLIFFSSQHRLQSVHRLHRFDVSDMFLVDKRVTVNWVIK